MKQKFAFLVVILALGFTSIAARAQDEPSVPVKPPKWVSEKGFWVVETTTHPEQCTIYFYNNDRELVYREAVAGKIKLHKRKTLLYIKSVLETAIAASEKNQPLSGNEKFFVTTR